MHVEVCTHMGVCMYEEHRLTLSIVHNGFSTFFETRSLTVLEAHLKVAGQRTPVTPLYLPPQDKHCRYTLLSPAFYMGAELWSSWW